MRRIDREKEVGFRRFVVVVLVTYQIWDKIYTIIWHANSVSTANPVYYPDSITNVIGRKKSWKLMA